MENGWDGSARAWVEAMAPDGDWARRAVLDRPMLDRIEGRGFGVALDLGCGEGRFCRAMSARGVRTIGVDPTAALLEQALRLDPTGDYRLGTAEALDIGAGAVDLAVSYLSLIDIPDLRAAVAGVHRALRDGGSFLIANLQSFTTAGEPGGWSRDAAGPWRFAFAGYLDERSHWLSWRGIAVRNWHRPLSTYMGELLRAGFQLVHFAEPEPAAGGGPEAARYRQAPYFLIMEWRKAGESTR